MRESTSWNQANGSTPHSIGGTVATIAGTGAAGFNGDDQPATEYIADSGNNVIRKVDPNGIISTVAGKR